MATENFSFNKENLERAKQIVTKYPDGRQKSATLPLLDIAQRQNGGWLSVPAIEYVANFLQQPYIRVYEVASFYTMFNLKPVGKYHIQVCGTTPCWLRDSDRVTKEFEKLTNAKKGETSEDGLFTITEVECLGACTNAPMVQINDDYHENLDSDAIKNLVLQMKENNLSGPTNSKAADAIAGSIAPELSNKSTSSTKKVTVKKASELKKEDATTSGKTNTDKKKRK